jgi:hypothetical protein
MLTRALILLVNSVLLAAAQYSFALVGLQDANDLLVGQARRFEDVD